MTKPKISVLMPVYNAEKYLREAIDSILNQTFKDFEFLIVNDGSTDKTAQILQSYHDSRIKIINNKANIGLTKSLNKGLKIAMAEYAARMDADDISLPERLEKQLTFMDKNKNVGLLGTSWLVIDEMGRITQTCQAYNGQQAIHFMCHGSVIIRKSCLKKEGNYREVFKYAQDYDLWLRLSETFEVTNLKEPLYKLRVHQDSISSTKKEEQDLYVALALKMAEERKRGQKDTFQMENKLNPSPLEKRKMFSKNYFTWAKAAHDLGDSPRAINYLKKSLNLIPWNFQTWVLLTKILINKFRKEIL